MSYGWLTESSFHSSKKQQHVIELNDSISIEKTKNLLIKEKEKLKKRDHNINNRIIIQLPSFSALPLYSILKRGDDKKTFYQTTIENNIKEKLSIKESIYEKLATNAELTKEEKEYKKRCLIDFDTKIIEQKKNKKEVIQSLIHKDYDDLFSFNDNNVNDSLKKEDNDQCDSIQSFAQLKHIKDQERRNRLLRVQKIKSLI